MARFLDYELLHFDFACQPLGAGMYSTMARRLSYLFSPSRPTVYASTFQIAPSLIKSHNCV